MTKLYAVYDRKSKSYGPIVGAAHDAVATRNFVASCGDQNSMLSRFPEDFELHCIGRFQDASDAAGTEERVFGCEPEVIVTAAAVRAMSQTAKVAHDQLELVREA